MENSNLSESNATHLPLFHIPTWPQSFFHEAVSDVLITNQQCGMNQSRRLGSWSEAEFRDLIPIY